MDTGADIISGTSIAGICLGGDGVSELLKIYEEGRAVNEVEFENFCFYEIDGGIVTVSVDRKSDKIKRLWCKKPYGGKYKGVLSPGMRVGDILECTSKQKIVCGFLIIDNDLNAGFGLPHEYEEADYVKDLPIDLVLDEFHVMEKGWCGPVRG